MSSLWTNLLYLHGYLTDPKLARQLVDKPEEPPREEPDKAQQESRHLRFRGNDGNARSGTSTWYARLCLGIGDGGLHWQ